MTGSVRHTLALAFLAAFTLGSVTFGEDVSRVGEPKPLSHGTPQRQAPYHPGKSPYVAGHRQRPRYFVPPTNPRTPTWKMYGLPPGVKPGDWPVYAPFGFGGYRFPAVGSQAYR